MVLTTFYPQKTLDIFQNAGLGGLCRWEDNIKMYLSEYNVVVWTGFIWFRIETSVRVLVNTVLNFWVP
jgi:hypothetical protein